MTNYRRNLVRGGSYFFTINLADRGLARLIDNIGLLRGGHFAKHEHALSQLKPL